MDKNGFFVCLVFILIFTLSSASAFPGFMILDGTVKIDNRDAQPGAVIEFYMNNEEIANSTVVSAGNYSVTINKDSSYVGNPINITIDGLKAEQEINYTSPGYLNLNLTSITNKSLKIIDFYPPQDNLTINRSTEQMFNLSISSGYNDSISYLWFLNETFVSNSSFYVLTNKTKGVYYLTALATDNYTYDMKLWEINLTEGDFDSDGYTENVDCDDNNLNINPGAQELCDSVDNNCDGQIDEEVKSTFYYDSDQDGYGTSSQYTLSCSAPLNYVTNNLDCNDNNLNINPGAQELCDSVDNNCNSQADEGVTTTFYRDNDNDGYGNPVSSTQTCSVPLGYTTNNNDCNDNSVSVNPGTSELCDSVDNNCNGVADEGFSIGASCSSGVGVCLSSGVSVCSSNNLNTVCNAVPKSPTTEICDGKDNNCDGQTDEGGICAVTSTEICDGIDNNGNGQVDEQLTKTITCGVGVCSRSATQTCNSGNWVGACTSGNPQTEVADGLDNNCNGQTDEGFLKIFYYDADGDNYGESYLSIQSAFPSGQYSAVNYGDCRPSDSKSFPGAQEMCDGADNNCNGIADQGENLKQSCYDIADKKYAGIGVCSYGYYACLGSYFSGTCVGAIAPIAEKCDGTDNDCDGQLDEDFDVDGDGYTTCGTTTDGKDTKADSIGVDCRDNASAVNTGMQELCDGIDNDCSGIRDDNLVYEPAHNQNGVCNGAVKICMGTNGWEEPNYSSIEGYESSELTCDGKDNNCDGQIDEGFPNLDGDKYADCVDNNIDGDRFDNSGDLIVGSTKNADSNIAFTLEVAGQNADSLSSSVRSSMSSETPILLTFKDSDGTLMAWFSHTFKENPLDFRRLILEKTSKGLLISGISSLENTRKVFILDRSANPTGKVCIKQSQINSLDEISPNCNLPDEVLISCNSQFIGNFRCDSEVRSKKRVYTVQGFSFYAATEATITNSSLYPQY